MALGDDFRKGIVGSQAGDYGKYLTASDTLTVNEQLCIVNATAGNVTVTMPNCLEAAWRIFHVVCQTAGGNAVTVSDAGASDALSVTLDADGEYVTLMSVGLRYVEICVGYS